MSDKDSSFKNPVDEIIADQIKAAEQRSRAVKAKNRSQDIGCLGSAFCFMGALSLAGISYFFPEYRQIILPADITLAIAALGFISYNFKSTIKYNREISEAETKHRQAFEKFQKLKNSRNSWHRRN